MSKNQCKVYAVYLLDKNWSMIAYQLMQTFICMENSLVHVIDYITPNREPFI